jgi:hypothetical protein
VDTPPGTIYYDSCTTRVHPRDPAPMALHHTLRAIPPTHGVDYRSTPCARRHLVRSPVRATLSTGAAAELGVLERSTPPSKESVALHKSRLVTTTIVTR